MTGQDVIDATQEVRAAFPRGKAFLTGSVLVAHDTANDIDFVVRGYLADAEYAIQAGWQACVQQDYGSALNAGWVAIRRGKVNVIIVFDDEHYERWQYATHALTALRDAGCVLNKEQRASLFTAIRGEFA